MSINHARRNRAITTTSWLAISMVVGTGGSALAQSTPAQGNPVEDSAVSEVIVVGARASQQSSIDRKKRASTPTDSIVADDVGSFPDRNINEAISRVAGTALNRNGFGEGEGVTIRGAGMEQTRVELDGMGVQSTYGLALGTGGGRSADMRELPSDLIKSVDIIKGSTPDMTEGSLSGAVKIQTRNGLDFKKPYLSLRVGAEQNSVGEDWTGDYNLVASRKFLDDRLGVILTGSYRGVRNDQHTNENAGSNGSGGEAAHWDWDNSAEKSYTFNPAITNGPDADVVFANSTETPRSLLTKSAAATTKVACFATFPYLDTGVDPATNFVAGQVVGGTPLTGPQATALNAANTTAITASNARKTQRINEQSTCLNQWNDLAPANIRSFMNSQEDKRTSIDLRFDYRVNDNLTIFAKVNRSERITDDQNRSRTLGNPQVNPAGRFYTTNGGANTPAQRYVNQNSTGVGYYTWTLDNLLPTAPSCLNPVPASPSGVCNQSNPMLGRPEATTPPVLLTPALQALQPGYPDAVSAGQSIPIRGLVTNINPASVVVDENHMVTAFDLSNNSASIDQIDNYQPSKTNYAQIGGDYNGDRMRIEFMAGMTKATSTRIDLRTNRTYAYGDASLSLLPSGVWSYELPSTYDDTNPANFVTLTAPINPQAAAAASATNRFATPAFTAAQLPLVTPNFGVTANPRAGESMEKVAKIDLTYDTSDFSPFITRVKVGLNFRENDIKSWGGGGATLRDPVGTFGAAGYIPGIYLPSNNTRGTYRACQETATSAAQRDGIIGSAETADVGLCNFGFVQTNPNARQGVDTLTADQLRALFSSTLENNDMRFFNSYETSGPGWSGIDTSALFAGLGNGQFTNLDCLYTCTATDGNVYEQPVASVAEQTIAAYYMADFEVEDLPFGMTFNGNVGMRGVHTDVGTSGQLVLQNIRIAGVDVNGAAIIDTRTFRQQVGLTRQTLDWLPSYNANLWVIPDKVVVRYYYGKQISRPNVSQLVPSGTCIVDERNDPSSQFYDGDSTSTCQGRIGNPALRPLTATNQSVNLEWYPNRDTSVSLVYQKADITIGGTRNTTTTGPLFAGSSQVDPLTGAPLSSLIFAYPTYENSPGFVRDGLEFTAKTAFTFLPWILRNTGADFNISTLKSKQQADPTFDPITGDVMQPVGEADYYTNLSVWYDDGRTQVRVSYQAKSETFNCITPCGQATISRNFPGAGLTNVGIPYYPGQPQFTDETKYYDAKISHNINDNVQIFVEGTNLTKQAQTYSTGEYRPYADGTPNILRISYNGMRIRTGVTFKFG